MVDVQHAGPRNRTSEQIRAKEGIVNRLKNVEHRGQEPLATYIGGLRFGLSNATIPLVRLELFSGYLRLSSSLRILRRMIPILEAEYVEIEEAQIVFNWLGSGIRIRSSDNESSAVFWTTKPEFVLSKMKELGVKTKSGRARFYYTNPER